MKIKIVKAVALILAMLCILCFPIPASAVSQGTDGTELSRTTTMSHFSASISLWTRSSAFRLMLQAQAMP